ncbi:hypothetical protein [Rhodococcus sp. X156]|uniref:hypothetical protein n=1 Tax=Rhodococcus sp. X156 TaxID=2499145 RepID=UPI000FD8466F|nr:hypothetical protein [Rhodococcus sp. X156]
MSAPNLETNHPAAVRGPDLAVGVGGTAVAATTALIGGVAVACAPLLEVVTSVAAPAGPQGLAAAVTALLAVGTPLLALWLLRGGRVVGAVGVLLGWAGASLAAAVLDLQLFTGAIDANRLELFRPTGAAALEAGAGVVAVLVGHVLAVLGGGLALWTLRRTALLDDPDVFDIGLLGGGEQEARGTSLAGKAGRGTTALVMVAAAVTAAAVFAPPLRSTDPVILVGSVVESPGPVLLGSALLALAVLVTVALALVSTSAAAGAGAVAGVALGALAVLAPRLVAGTLLDRLGAGAGSLVGTAGALLLAGCALLLVRRSRFGTPRSATERAATEVQLPALSRLHRLAGGSAVAAGAVAVVAALLPVLAVPAGVPQPDVHAVRVLLLAGVLLAAAGVAMLPSELGAEVRPVVAVLWAAPLLGAGGVLEAVRVAVSVPGVGLGAGAWLTVLSVLLAGVAGAAAGLAGAVERDEVDLSRQRDPLPGVRTCAGVAAAAALLGLGLPLYSGGEAEAAAIFSTSWGWDTWTLAVVALTVLSALGVATSARLPRALALLAGVELVLVVHLLSWPLTAGRLPDPTVGLGVVLTGLAMVVTAVLAVALHRQGTQRPVAEES